MAACVWAMPSHAHAASFTPKDLKVLGRAVAFMVPPPATESFIAIVHAPGNAASRQDAEAIAVLIGGGLRAGGSVLRPKIMDTSSAAAGGFAVVIAATGAAAGASGAQLNASARAARALCVTTEIEAVRAGLCAMAITSAPRVEIVLNHAASAAAGIGFAAAFRMMIREI